MKIHPQRTANVLGFGNFASIFFPRFWNAALQLGAVGIMRTIGILSIGQVMPAPTTSYEERDIRMISPKEEEVEDALNQTGDANEATEYLMHRMIDKLVEANMMLKHPQPHVLLIQDMLISQGDD